MAAEKQLRILPAAARLAKLESVCHNLVERERGLKCTRGPYLPTQEAEVHLPVNKA